MKILFSFLAILLCLNGYSQCDRSADSLTLVNFYESTGGPEWTESWDLNAPIDTWRGIHLNEEGCVEIIDLDDEDDGFISFSFMGNGLKGNLPSSLVDLKYLKRLIIFNADFEGEIPEFLSEMSSLELLSIRVSNLTGELPTSLINLKKLYYLSFSFNELSGEIPDEFGNFENLQFLYLSGNHLEGEIPSSLGTLDSLIVFGAGLNQLSGEVPGNFAFLPRLENLLLRDNNLEGCIPQSFIDSCHIIFDLSNNKRLPLSGNIEDLCSITDQVGLSCDDGFLGTVDDVINEDCECVGVEKIYDCWCDISGTYNFSTIPIGNWCLMEDVVVEGVLTFEETEDDAYDVYVIDETGNLNLDMSFGSYTDCYGFGVEFPEGDLKLNVDCQTFYWTGMSQWSEEYYMDDVYYNEDTLILEISNSYGEKWISTLTKTDSTIWSDEMCVLDEDQDGFIQAEDCNDRNADINPMQEEIPYNGLDDDCNEATPDDDLDGDGYFVEDDCNDLDSLINPGALEIVNNEVDENCDGEIGTSSTLEISGVSYSISPNPSSEYILIEGELNTESKIRVIDSNGRVVLSSRLLTPTISVVDLPNGIYFLQLINEKSNEITIEKIAVLK